jgi:hypothetical protein
MCSRLLGMCGLLNFPFMAAAWKGAGPERRSWLLRVREDIFTTRWWSWQLHRAEQCCSDASTHRVCMGKFIKRRACSRRVQMRSRPPGLCVDHWHSCRGSMVSELIRFWGAEGQCGCSCDLMIVLTVA